MTGMTTATVEQKELRVSCGSLALSDVNAGYVIIPNDKARRVTIHDIWVRAIGTASAGTSVLVCEYRPTVICASVSVNDTVTVNGYTFTAKATENINARQFNQASTDGAAATSLAANINAPGTGVPGVTALVSTATITLVSGGNPVLTTSNSTRLAVDSTYNTFATFTQAILTNGAIVRAGKTGSLTPTYMGPPATTTYPVQIICASGLLATTTYLDFVVKYTVV